MRTGRADAVAIFDTWRADRALLRVEFVFTLLAATFRARMVGASDAEIRLMADDTWAELVFPLRDDFAFGYADMRDAPEEADLFVRGIMIFFPYEGDPEQADRIVLAELVE